MLPNLSKEDNGSVGSAESAGSSQSPTSETTSVSSSKDGNTMLEITKGEERAVSWFRFVFL